MKLLPCNDVQATIKNFGLIEIKAPDLTGVFYFI